MCYSTRSEEFCQPCEAKPWPVVAFQDSGEITICVDNIFCKHCPTDGWSFLWVLKACVSLLCSTENGCLCDLYFWKISTAKRIYKISVYRWLYSRVMGRVEHKAQILCFITEYSLKKVSSAYLGKLTQPRPGTVFSALSEEIMQKITFLGTSCLGFWDIVWTCEVCILTRCFQHVIG